MDLSKKEKLFSFAAALLTAAASIALFTLLSYWLEQKKQHAELQLVSERSFKRANSVLLEFESGFKSLASVPVSGCSDETIARLHNTVKNSYYLKSAAIEIGQNTYCSDSGLIYQDRQQPDYITQDGASVWLNRQNSLNSKLNTLYIQRGGIILSTLHALLLDVVTPDTTGIVMFSSKTLQIIARHPPLVTIDPAVMKSLAMTDGGGGADKLRLYNSRRNDTLAFTVIAFSDKIPLAAHWLGSIWLWLPIGLLSGLLAGYGFFKRMELQYTPVQMLSNAIKHRHFLVYYQPIVSLHNGKCIGAETLIRWKGLDGVIIHPDAFIPLAEETGMIESLTDIMFESAMQEMAGRLATGDFYISFNLSSSDMAKPRYFDMISVRLHELGIAPGKIAIEATERSFLDVAQANDVIKLYHKAGHSVFIDDFGTGYSSLSYLQKLTVDVIKIDKTFVDTIGTGAATSSVVIDIISMAKHLNLKIIAEGVENVVQVEFLRQHGVDAVQGYYFAKPMPAEAFLRYIDQDRDLADL